MRYAVISDIHSNLEALEAFLKKAASLGINEILCLGDIVGYNANPNECCALMRETNARCIMGNHDSRAIGLEDTFGFNRYAEEAVLWTARELTAQNRDFLEKLPRSLIVENKFLAVHGWVNDTDRYIIGESATLRNFELMKQFTPPVKLCFFGHTHVPVVYVEGGEKTDGSAIGQLQLSGNDSSLINPGSIGQPRDSDPRASFLVYDSKKSTVQFHRVEYDIKTAAEKVIAANLPRRLAERLRLGW
ncbi:MAG: metallophosphoesterase family protein [Deltaproteobacteria bacterium]|nr:metallophosphoesterase family protein [Deltaproteobacteria bacterium]